MIKARGALPAAAGHKLSDIGSVRLNCYRSTHFLTLGLDKYAKMLYAVISDFNGLKREKQ